ncbi:family 1 encapsulin nanocompartment shell protein [Streptacidiphilus sp. P02-A3a]|uniref:family 1 encapsulin nanocompartment shell protein n=1 Tax=Streptacidiphilus sp. P02-A3a TaxID=2704468 RepID=UPI0015FD5B76|nr:family 1 encapsulin nanocompartment shell protein [Streptacidiphilus sp. P02-A3a]QMU69466.1 bacteriocin family protein [Streptacidiphilus sp. P02-A3a]
MNNLHRDLAPISAAAWAEIEEEARRTFKRHIAGRRVVDVQGPDGTTLSAIGTGGLREISAPGHGVTARLHELQPVVELRIPFTVERDAVDSVERGAKDADWQPVKDAARRAAFAEDRLIFDGFPEAGIGGVRPGASHPPLPLPEDPRDYAEAVSRALTALRLAGVGGPYTLLLSADAYTAVSETVDQGFPILTHLSRLLDGEIIWAPALDGAVLLSTRGGDYELHLGQDLSIGYRSHDTAVVELYLQETLTFRLYTDEAVISLDD